MRKADALRLVEFIQAWQVSHPGDVFQFSHWINDDGELKDPVEDDNCQGREDLTDSSCFLGG